MKKILFWRTVAYFAMFVAVLLSFLSYSIAGPFATVFAIAYLLGTIVSSFQVFRPSPKKDRVNTFGAVIAVFVATIYAPSLLEVFVGNIFFLYKGIISFFLVIFIAVLMILPVTGKWSQKIGKKIEERDKMKAKEKTDKFPENISIKPKEKLQKIKIMKRLFFFFYAISLAVTIVAIILAIFGFEMIWPISFGSFFSIVFSTIAGFSTRIEKERSMIKWLAENSILLSPLYLIIFCLSIPVWVEEIVGITAGIDLSFWLKLLVFIFGSFFTISFFGWKAVQDIFQRIWERIDARSIKIKR